MKTSSECLEWLDCFECDGIGTYVDEHEGVVSCTFCNGTGMFDEKKYFDDRIAREDESEYIKTACENSGSAHGLVQALLESYGTDRAFQVSFLTALLLSRRLPAGVSSANLMREALEHLETGTPKVPGSS